MTYNTAGVDSEKYLKTRKKMLIAWAKTDFKKYEYQRGRKE